MKLKGDRGERETDRQGEVRGRKGGGEGLTRESGDRKGGGENGRD